MAGQIIFSYFTILFQRMRQILLFGAGKSSTALIDYFLVNAGTENWLLTVVDASLEAIKDKTGDSLHAVPVAMDIRQETERKILIGKADIVVSLLPPSLHILVAKDCLFFKKNLLTASYVDEQIRQLSDAVESAGLLFLCEMGLDPGIDHMSAKKLIDSIHDNGGHITSFLSHCGGLVAPESDDNPWHYKISWNPRNVVLAGKAGAIYKQEGEIKELEYDALFASRRFVSIPGFDALCWYPNRDSLSYIQKYGMEETATFIRTTLRHPDFIYGWKNLIELKLTDEEVRYETDGKTFLQFFKEHLDRNDFNEWLESKLHNQIDSTKDLLTELVTLVKMEEQAADMGFKTVEEFMVVDDRGDLQNIDIDQLKINAAATLADKMHDASLTLKQLLFLGLDDDKTIINKGKCSAADILQLALEQKLMLKPSDKDMVIMLHELEYVNKDKKQKVTSTLRLNGENAVYTAMAKTVGLPLAIATKLILNGNIKEKGIHIPVSREIYEPVLRELEENGILFKEEKVDLT